MDSIRRSETPFRGRSLSLELHFEVQNSFRGGLYDISKRQTMVFRRSGIQRRTGILKIWKFFRGGLLSERSRPRYFEDRPISRQIRFASFWRSSSRIQSYRLFRRLPDEFED
ncbi:hypothetical protein RclHR1_12720004 [Rhizophagus clarus]|uniref:Uncharacterized protein n=1 Tax=Rhizophagus clarus TaxID=94130 RepID=A0A2Z6Q7Z2_9GLOM|nr:hypothetical protein RclHR1_12720004 [Rhizophagus clarus]